MGAPIYTSSGEGGWKRHFRGATTFQGGAVTSSGEAGGRLEGGASVPPLAILLDPPMKLNDMQNDLVISFKFNVQCQATSFHSHFTKHLNHWIMPVIMLSSLWLVSYFVQKL